MKPCQVINLVFQTDSKPTYSTQGLFPLVWLPWSPQRLPARPRFGVRGVLLAHVTQFGPRNPGFSRGIFKSACKSRDYIFLFQGWVKPWPPFAQGLSSLQNGFDPTQSHGPYGVRTDSTRANRCGLCLPFFEGTY